MSNYQLTGESYNPFNTENFRTFFRFIQQPMDEFLSRTAKITEKRIFFGQRPLLLPKTVKNAMKKEKRLFI